VAFWLYLTLVLGVVLTLVAPRVSRTLPPRTAVWVLSGTAVASTLGIISSLVMLALSGAARIPALAHESNVSAVRWRHVDPIAAWTASLATITTLIVLALFVYAVARESVSRIGVRRLARSMPGDDRLVLVDDDVPHAYALAGRPGRIVVSSGLLRSLSADERRAVLSHENAHMRHRHDVHLRVLRIASAMNPLLRSCESAARLAVERWADEETASAVGDRTLVARALVRAALAGAARARPPDGSLAHTAGDVSHRVAALLEAPPRPRWWIAAAMSALLLATVVAPIYAADSFDNLLNSATVAAASK
jgi:Zn-dependent protease with chaperone function